MLNIKKYLYNFVLKKKLKFKNVSVCVFKTEVFNAIKIGRSKNAKHGLQRSNFNTNYIEFSEE